jgi:hypothetical protein
MSRISSAISRFAMGLQNSDTKLPVWPPTMTSEGTAYSAESYVAAVIQGCLLRTDRYTPFRILRMPAWIKAGLLSERFVHTVLQGVPTFRTRFELIQAGLSSAPSRGLVLEFGVFDGASINEIARMTKSRFDSTVHGFDTFEGLPEDWTIGCTRGSFGLTEMPQVHPNVNLVKGLFQDTLLEFLEHHSQPLAFAHVDCDLLSSAHFVLESLEKLGRLQSGSVLVFDEYLGYPGWWRGGEFRALSKLCEDHGLSFEYLGRVARGTQISIKIER